MVRSSTNASPLKTRTGISMLMAVLWYWMSCAARAPAATRPTKRRARIMVLFMKSAFSRCESRRMREAIISRPGKRGSGMRLAALRGRALEDVQAVGQGGEDRLEALAGPAFAAGQIDDERRAPEAGGGPAEDGRRGLFGPGPAHGLGEAGGLPVDHGLGRFRGPVARAEPRPAGRQDEVEALVRPGDEDPADLRLLVGDDRRPDDLAAGRLDDAADGRTAAVLALAARSLVAHREDPDFHRQPPILNMS